MKQLQGFFGLGLPVNDLVESSEFYTEVFEMAAGPVSEDRTQILALPGKKGILVLQERKEGFPKFHLVFSVLPGDLESVATLVKWKSVATTPILKQQWLNSKSFTFLDLDGHTIEVMALMPQGG
jgi:predicted lactoylglutathione lyase